MCRVHERKTLSKSLILPRRLVVTAKINLNKFWTELEEIYQSRTSSTLLVLPELEDENVEEQNRFNEEREKRELHCITEVQSWRILIWIKFFKMTLWIYLEQILSWRAQILDVAAPGEIETNSWAWRRNPRPGREYLDIMKAEPETLLSQILIIANEFKRI